MKVKQIFVIFLAVCATANAQDKLVSPNQIDLEGTERRETVSTSLGQMDIRWQRDSERYLRSNPLNAVTQTARGVSRFLRSGAFPTSISDLDLDWDIVFLGRNLPQGQIPVYLINNCHPGWMRAQGNKAEVYIRVDAIAAGCGGSSKVAAKIADSKLAQVLVHEMGHAVEHFLLNGNAGSDRMIREGFASWFEQEGAKYLPILNSSEIKDYYLKLAKYRHSQGEFTFMGSANDYALASMFFHAIVDRAGVRGLMRVYQGMAESKVGFFRATEDKLGWSRERFEKEVDKYLSN